MSADNFVGVRPKKDSPGWYDIFEYGCMSILDEDCMYLADANPTRIEFGRPMALTTAHDIVNAMGICEYGVIELEAIPDKLCGRCFVCVNERKIVADDIQRCDKCNQPISSGEWMTSTSEGTFHSSCERELLSNS